MPTDFEMVKNQTEVANPCSNESQYLSKEKMENIFWEYVRVKQHEKIT